MISAFSGVRPLFDDGKGNPSAVTRDYVFDLDETGGAPVLSVFGGKITTFRKLAEHAIQRLAKFFPKMGTDWTARATLPGGEIANADFEAFLRALRQEFAWLPDSLATHYARLYGARARELIGATRSVEGLGRRFGPDLYEVEVRYLMKREWAQTMEDIVMRRTKHHLGMTAVQKEALKVWLEDAKATAA